MSEVCITHAQEKVCYKECDCETNNKPIIIPKKLKKYWGIMDRYKRKPMWWNISKRKF